MKHLHNTKTPVWSKVKIALFTIIALCSTAMISCSKRTTEPITVTPNVLVLSPNIDNEIDLEAVLNVPANYVSKRGMVNVEPVLVLGDHVYERFKPVTLAGPIYKKKMDRLNVLNHVGKAALPNAQIIDVNEPVTLQLRENIRLNEDFQSGQVLAYVQRDGCDCQGQDTVVVAYLSNLSNLIDADVLLVQWIDTVPPEEQKFRSGDGMARLQFVVDKWDIVPELANNAAEMDSMLTALTPVLKDSLSTLKSLSIFGSASAEGGYKHNVELAQKRANSAKEWINSRLTLTPQQLNLIEIGSEPEGWWPVIASMHAAGNPDSALVKEIVLKYPDVKSFEAERRIRKLACWPEIAEKHLAKDRKVIYKYSYEIRAFKTDAEKLEMFDKRPDAFNEAEFLRVAKLKEGNIDSLIYVYETMLRYQPKSDIAVNNLAVLYYNNGMYEKAKELLEAQSDPTADMITTLALCYVKTGNDDKAIDLLKGVATDKAIYNLGIIQANNHKMAEAYENLQGVKDLNAAIVALGVDANQEAWDILADLNDFSPKADYVRAIAQARLGDYDKSIRYLKKAIADPKYLQRAKTEADFMPMQNEWKFQQLFK